MSIRALLLHHRDNGHWPFIAVPFPRFRIIPRHQAQVMDKELWSGRQSQRARWLTRKRSILRPYSLKPSQKAWNRKPRSIVTSTKLQSRAPRFVKQYSLSPSKKRLYTYMPSATLNLSYSEFVATVSVFYETNEEWQSTWNVSEASKWSLDALECPMWEPKHICQQ